MRKKSNTTKKAAAPAGRTAKPATGKQAPARRAAAKPQAPRATAPVPPPSTDDIATRAYDLEEKRRTDGLPGDEQQDWIEAERQLRAEAAGQKRPAKSKKA